MFDKTLLINGGSHADISLIEAAKKQGFYVITIGSRESDLGHKYSDEYHNIDYCDDEAICELIKKRQIDFICPSCNDFAFIATAKAAHRLNLPGNYDEMDAIYTLHYKDKYREFALKHNISSPKAMGFDEEEAALAEIKNWHFPLISKPADFCGGRGIAKINNFNEAREAINFTLSNSRIKKCVIEEFVEGSNHGFSAILQNQKIVFYFVDNEYYYKNPFRVSGASCPSDVPPDAVKKIIFESEKIANLLNLKDGIFHVQFILHNNDPIIIEITRRPPGDLYIKLVEYTTNVNYSDYLLRFYTGQNVPDLKQVEPIACILRHCIMSDKNGRIKNVAYDSAIKSKIIDQLILGEIGDNIDDMMTYKYGIAFLKFDSAKELNLAASNMQELIKIET
jgi:biotin carboxylase